MQEACNNTELANVPNLESWDDGISEKKKKTTRELPWHL
jgi:hypothetical protein